MKAPQLNPEVESHLQDNTKKRDNGFVETQTKMGLVMAAVSPGHTFLMEENEKQFDKLQLLDMLWGTEMILAALRHKQSQMRHL